VKALVARSAGDDLAFLSSCNMVSTKIISVVTTILAYMCCCYLLEGAAAFAAKKKGAKKRSSSASTNRGFGQPPPTLDETLAAFKTRRPEHAEEQPCPCGITDDTTFGACCAPYLRQEKMPLSPTRVLQSRYSAFCFRDVGHILRTTHPSCRDYQDDKIAWAKELNKNGMFDSFDFVGLEILGDEEHTSDTEAFVEFEVKLRANQRTGSMLVEGQQSTIRERSKFLKDEATGIWSYASGDVRSTVEGVDDIILNA